VEKGSLNLRAIYCTLCCAGLLSLGSARVFAQSQYGAQSSSSKSFSSGVKDGWDKLTGAFTPAKTTSSAEKMDDAVSLKNPAKASSNVYVAVAHMYEQSGKLADAEKQYQMAIKEKPNDLSAILGYARLREEMGKPNEAIALYQKAVKINPEEAVVQNNLGMCYARNNMLDEACAAMGRAILLQPKNVLYRNNMAAILVEKGKMQEAYSHLRSVHGDAEAYYNLGFLLYKKGKNQEALQHFTVAAQLDPSLVQAKQMTQKLQGASAPSVPPAVVQSQPRSKPAKLDPSDLSGAVTRSQPTLSDRPPMPPELSTPVRLPPISEPPSHPSMDLPEPPVPETARLPARDYRLPAMPSPSSAPSAAQGRRIEMLPPIH
jgi:tetratricopeptide (TPR) repeat protein